MGKNLSFFEISFCWYLVASGGPGFKPSTQLLPGFVLGLPEFRSCTALCILPTGLLLACGDVCLQCLF